MRFAPKKYLYLWSADFHFNAAARNAADSLLNNQLETDLLVGTFKGTARKEAVDRRATFPLIENWFPDEYRTMREAGFFKPRSELLRFSTIFLSFTFSKRWFPTEQSIHLIFQCLWDMENFSAAPVDLGEISDDDEERAHPNVIQQIDRMDVWLKYMWREHQTELHRGGWQYCDFLRKSVRSFNLIQEAYAGLLGKQNNSYVMNGDMKTWRVMGMTMPH